MKKRKISSIFAAAVFMSCAAGFTGCGEGNTPPAVTDPVDYIIQYSDDAGAHRITVTAGMPYAMESLPVRNGYEFTGLFDAEVGGVQYVSASGSSLSPYTDGKNMVLFPQFKAKEFTLFLDYQGAPVTGSREYAVSYGERLPELPKNLNIENKNFVGWYTKPNREGVRVADEYGLLATTSFVNESNFTLSDTDRFIYLYAGFEGEKYTVTCCFEAGVEPEEIEVEYGTPVSKIVTETRVNGKVPLAWSKTEGGIPFNGKITEDTVLYALEYASIIDFDSNGGKQVDSLVARAGDPVVLPTPERENYKFVCWQDNGGNVYNATMMPQDSIRLTAKWQAKILFDPNGGTAVQEISQEQGTQITLPTTEKAGFLFAGWYTENGEKYESSAMPAISVKLQAKYWTIKKLVKVIIQKTESFKFDETVPSITQNCNVVDLSELYNAGIRQINVKAHYVTWRSSNTGTTAMNWYSREYASEAYLVWGYSESHTVVNEQKSLDRVGVIPLNSPKLYICRWTSTSSGWAFVTDFYVEIEYPDMSTLY